MHEERRFWLTIWCSFFAMICVIAISVCTAWYLNTKTFAENNCVETSSTHPGREGVWTDYDCNPQE